VKIVTLKRNQESEQGTFGKLFIDGVEKWFFSLELPFVDKDVDGVGDKNTSRIPVGRYTITWKNSPSRGRNVYWVLGVPGRDSVQIHSGNYAGTNGLKSDVLGCILLGNSIGKTGGQNCIFESKAAIAHFEQLMAHEDGILQVEEHFGKNV
jgi:hypothetical protein